MKKKELLVLAGIFLFDLGYSGQGLLSLAVAAVGVVWLSVRGRWARAGAYLVLGVAAYGTVQFHQATARRHAADVIAACQSYKARHGALPSTLSQLVPEFLPAVPRAKYTLAYGDFTYSAPPNGAHTLMYVALPPFGRRVYRFEEGAWSTFD